LPFEIKGKDLIEDSYRACMYTLFN